MNKITRKLGMFMSLLGLISFVLYTFCFTAILFVNPSFVWMDINALAEYEAATVSAYKYIGMACMIFYSLAFVVICVCITEALTENKKILGRLGSLFALAFCICISINYYVQITSTRLQLNCEIMEGLSQFTQSNSISALNGINMLGWTLFYGVASLFLAFAFNGKGIGRVTKAACLFNSVLMTVGLIGYVINNFTILLFTMNLGLGAAGILLLICFLRYFIRKSVISVV